MSKFYPEKIKLFKRKETKYYLLGMDGRLKKVFRTKLGLVPFKEWHFHGGMTIQDI